MVCIKVKNDAEKVKKRWSVFLFAPSKTFYDYC